MIRRAAPRRGFTMVELLVVVGVIAILASLITVAALRVQKVAKRTRASAEIAQISAAVSTFKAKMNVDFIPSGGGGPNGTFQLKKVYAGNEPEAKYLKRLFPQMKGCTGDPNENTGLPDGFNLDGNQTLVLFLTGGDVTKFTGFSTNRQQPFTPTATDGENRLGPFLEFSSNNYVLGSNLPGVAGAQSLSYLVDPWGSPYAYFAFNPLNNMYDAGQSFAFNGTTVRAYRERLDPTRPTLTPKGLQPKGFQLISAGENGKDDEDPRGFGPGGKLDTTGEWTPGVGAYADGGAGFDDLSNFHEGQLGVK
ncbi:type II secretion system protein [bacterium]|nr:type II secretion system protein [bacterium]